MKGNELVGEEWIKENLKLNSKSLSWHNQRGLIKSYRLPNTEKNLYEVEGVHRLARKIWNDRVELAQLLNVIKNKGENK